LSRSATTCANGCTTTDVVEVDVVVDVPIDVTAIAATGTTAATDATAGDEDGAL
jgi:hypothetical protein